MTTTIVTGISTSSEPIASQPSVKVAAIPSEKSPVPTPVVSLKADTVKLSLTANIKLMRHQGMSPSTIAAQLGLSAKQIEAYFPGASTPTTVTPQRATETIPKQPATAPGTPLPAGK